jgi:hypothetical protein
MGMKRKARARLMTPAEAEFDVTDDAQVSSLLAGHDGPVCAHSVLTAEQPEPAAFVTSIGSLRTPRGSW